ncbi:MAG: DUF1802 family protein [Methanobacteriaceae archaeon]|nr:DUF1802 family protein [Methanobacteriaceae archaeon]
MNNITKCLNESKVIVETLGQGKQSILIRPYETDVKEFLLYPNIRYSNNDSLNELEDNIEFYNKKTEIKYFAKVEETIERESFNPKANTLDLWSSIKETIDIEKEYLYIWLLRIYKLNEPILLSRTKEEPFSKVDKEVSLDNITPVISDSKFERIKKSFIYDE